MFDKLRAKLPSGFADRLRSTMIGMNTHINAVDDNRRTRWLGDAAAVIARRPGELLATLAGLTETQAFHHAETSTWLSPEAIAQGESGPFEALNLLSWIEIAKSAGVAHIPAVPILHVADAECDRLSGAINLPDTGIPGQIRKRVRTAIDQDPEAFAALASETAPDEPVDVADLAERLSSCLDGVPEGWMVRSTQTGPSTLKVLACTGLAEEQAPEARFGPDLQIGPGWVRNGNRRRVDVTDRRLTGAYAQGPHHGMTFVARPWMVASRYIEGRDPHRPGPAGDVPGRWPAEWRAFVRDGRVIGISSYYTWLDAPSPFTAGIALQVRDLAQRIVDAAIAQGLEPKFMQQEMARRNPHLDAVCEASGYGRGTFACTLDFLETTQGILLLEGGPGATPVGGGHPCAFAGYRTDGPPAVGRPMVTEGVAFRQMPHIVMPDPSTWCDGDAEGCILTWDEVEALADGAAA